MKTKFLLPLTALLSLLSTQVLASTPAVNTQAHIGSYNLVIKNDLNVNSHIDGKGIIGGDINSANSSNITEFGSKISDSSVDSVVVLGDVDGTLKAQSGTNIVYGTLTGTLQLNGSGGISTQIKDTVTVQNNFDDIWDQVVADSQTFKNLSATGIFNMATPNGNNGMKFENDNSLELNVFNISTTGLTSYGGFDFDYTPTAPVVINVGGTGTINLTSKALGNLTSPSSASNVLWNFYEATTINFANDTWWGSVLAPKADLYVTNGNNLEGGIAALSLTTNKEVHNALYTYTPPTTTPPDEVPAPATTLILALGLLLIAGRQLKK